MKIYIDDREDKKRVSKIESHFSNCEIKRLKTGDILIEEKNLPTIAIEVKSVQDFCASVKNRRIQKEALNMKKEYPYSFIIVYGNFNDLNYKYCTLSKKLRYGNILSLMQRYKVPVICVDTVKDLIICMENLITLQKKLNEPIQPPIVRNKSSNVYVNVLIGIPGVGKKTAEKLLDYFKTPQAVFNATEEELDKIKINKKIKTNILFMRQQNE